MGPRFRLYRPTALARELRNGATDAERLLWKQLRRSQLGGFKFSRQMPVAGYIADFICRERKLIVEIDGSQHADDAARDGARTAALNQLGFRVIRFWNNDLTTNMAGVLQTILDAAEEAPTPQPPPARGRGREL